MRTRRLVLFGVCVIALAVVVALMLRAPRPLNSRARLSDSAADTALRRLADRFYRAQAGRDVEGFVALWDPDSPDLAERRMLLRKRLATYDTIEIREIAVADLALTDAGATIEVRVEMHAREPKTGALATGFGRMRRVIDCVRRDGAWKVRREFAVEDRLATALVEAPSDKDRVAALASATDMSTGEIFGALTRRAERRHLEGDAKTALAILDLAHRLAEQTGDHVQVARALTSLGAFHMRSGTFGTALDFYVKALAVPGAAADAEGRARALSDLGSVHARRGEYRQALEVLEESLALRDAAGHSADTGATLRHVGSVHLLQGDYERASTYYSKSLALAEALDDTTLAALTLSNLGAIEHERGNYQPALAYYGRTVALGDAIERRAAFSIALNNIGLIHRLQGRHDLAREYLTRSLRLSEAAGDKDRIASTLLNIGMVERLQGHADKALEYYERSLSLREANGQKDGAALALNSIGLLHHFAGRDDRALTYYQRSLSISEELRNSARIAQTTANVAMAHHTRGEYAQALAAARRAVSVAREIGQGGEVLWTSLAAMGQAYKRLRQPDLARQSLEDAIAALEAMRAAAGGSAQEQQAFLESRLVAYEELTDLLVTEGDVVGALASAERARARVLLDVLQRGRVDIAKAMTADERAHETALRAELSARNTQLRRNRAASDRARLEADVRNARLGLEAFQTSVYAAHPELKVQRGEARLFDASEAHTVLPDARTAALEFVVMQEQTLVFVLTRTSGDPAVNAGDRGASFVLRVHRIPVTRAELTARVSEFRTLITTRNLRVRDLAARLFQTLIEPARKDLAGMSALVIVPDDTLWELPFQALQPAPDRYLIEDYALSYAPSLTVLRETRRLARAPDRAAPPTLLAFGNPTVGTRSRTPSATPVMTGDLEPLPDTERQVELLGQLYGADRSRVYVGKAADEARAKAEAGTYRILHLATHGVLDDESPMHSYVVLSQAADAREREDGLLEAWELMNLELAADLVVLSACETGRGRFGAGEGVIGMSWAAFVAGSPATVVSLWKVEARSTTELMVEFHRQLLAIPAPADPAPSKAEALQRAALKLLGDARYRHPFYWAGFVLVGDTAPARPHASSGSR